MQKLGLFVFKFGCACLWASVAIVVSRIVTGVVGFLLTENLTIEEFSGGLLFVGIALSLFGLLVDAIIKENLR